MKPSWYAAISHDETTILRFGPFSESVASKIVDWCHGEGVPASRICDMGTEVKMADTIMENIKRLNERRALGKLDAPPLQKLWVEHPPPWTVKVENGRGVITDRAKQRVTGFDAETDGIYHLGIVAAINAAAEVHPPDKSITKPGFKFYRVGDIIDDPQCNLDVLPPLVAGEEVTEAKPAKPNRRKKS